MKKLRVYEYAKCSTCRNALKFLDRRSIPYEKIPIVDTPPTKAELRRMLIAQGGNIRKLFNTSGEAYRAMGIGSKIDSMSEAEALDLLASNGKLIKRPFLLGETVGMVGFREVDWKKAL
jgi:Spx/MgsR family transcriptional regulator